MARSIRGRRSVLLGVLSFVGLAVAASCLLDSGGGQFSSDADPGLPLSYRDVPALLPVDALIEDLHRRAQPDRPTDVPAWLMRLAVGLRYGHGAL